MKRDFLDLSSISVAEGHALLNLASWLKSDLKNGLDHPYLRGKTLGDAVSEALVAHAIDL